jgi:hypothetical protein
MVGLSDRIQESVGGLQEIYANDTVAYESGRFRHLLQRIFKIRLGIYNLKYLIKWINNFLEKFGVFLLLVGGWLIIQPGSSTSGFWSLPGVRAAERALARADQLLPAAEGARVSRRHRELRRPGSGEFPREDAPDAGPGRAYELRQERPPRQATRPGSPRLPWPREHVA